MRLWFSIGFFVFSLAFTIFPLYSLDIFAVTGQPGPGYFPLIVGVLLILCTGINCVKELKARTCLKDSVLAAGNESDGKKNGGGSLSAEGYARDTLITGLLITLFIFLLDYLGCILSMMVFIFIFMWHFNRGKVLFNTIYSILLPVSVHILFVVWLHASLPRGVFGQF